MSGRSGLPDAVLAAPRVRLPVVDCAGVAQARFPVRRIYCVGRNYAAHAREMGHDPEREPPFFFQKNPEDVLRDDEWIAFPPSTADLHHEVELVVALKGGGAELSPKEAAACVHALAVGIDFTRRDLQAEAKRLSRPWALSKSFAGSAPVGGLRPVAEVGLPAQGAIWLEVNGARRQEGDLDQMIWPVPELLAELSRFEALAPGDLIFTGTPAGVGPVVRGDTVTCGIAGLPGLEVRPV